MVDQSIYTVNKVPASFTKETKVYFHLPTYYVILFVKPAGGAQVLIAIPTYVMPSTKW